MKEGRFFYRCMSRRTIVKIRKILVTGFSIFFLLHKLQNFLCPDYIQELESYGTVSKAIERKYVNTLEKYLMNNSEYYHLTQVYSNNQSKLDRRFQFLLMHHYFYFVEIEDTKEWDAELMEEIKSNFSTSLRRDDFLSDKVIMYSIQEMVAEKHGYHPSFFMEIGMNDLLRNYSTQALIFWYHWRGIILETDLVSLHNYVSQPIHSTIMSNTAVCTEDGRTFHYLTINPDAVLPHLRNRYRLLYRVPCYPLKSYGDMFLSEHFEYFIVGPRCDLIPLLETIVKEKNVHFILVIMERNTLEKNSKVSQLTTRENFSLFYQKESIHYSYLLFYKFIERPGREGLKFKEYENKI